MGDARVVGAGVGLWEMGFPWGGHAWMMTRGGVLNRGSKAPVWKEKGARPSLTQGEKGGGHLAAGFLAGFGDGVDLGGVDAEGVADFDAGEGGGVCGAGFEFAEVVAVDV